MSPGLTRHTLARLASTRYCSTQLRAQVVPSGAEPFRANPSARPTVRPTVTLLVLALLACGNPFSPPPGTVAFTPPAIYRSWWADMETCAARTGDMRRVAWYAAPDVNIPYYDVHATGVWAAPHTIYLAAQVVDTTWQIVVAEGTATDYRRHIVQHEMLHDLLQTGRHPPIFAQCGL